MLADATFSQSCISEAGVDVGILKVRFPIELLYLVCHSDKYPALKICP